MVILSILMFVLPPLFSWGIHIYLRHGDVSERRRIVLFYLYALLDNALTFAVSYIRGIKGLNFETMTLSYRLKYMGLGCVFGFVTPFFVCLATEDQITIGGFKRYAKRFIRDLKKYIPYAIWSARADLKAEVANSYLNWMWWLIEPVCMMLIYAVMFTFVFNAEEQYFTIFIFVGLTMWGFFSRNVNASVGIVRANKDIITKIYMPKYILLLAKMFVNGFKMMISFGIIIGMMIFYKVPISVELIWVIPILIILFLFTFGVGAVMMHYGVYVNDLGYITEIVLQMMMYLTGVFYSVSKRIPEPFGPIMESFNPVASIISSLRDALLYSTRPQLPLLALWLFVSAVLIALGVFTIYSNENAYVKVI